MGKVRLTTIGDEGQEAKEKAEKDLKREQKKAREEADSTTSEKTETETSEEAQKENTEAPKQEAKKEKKAKFLKKSQKRSNKYNSAVMTIDKAKYYSLPEALELLRSVKLAKFDETVELHINTTETGISGQVKLPHGNGKELRIAIADDATLAEVEKGKINFDILIATPASMPKLAKVARVLGPRGLMPNPKNGTISDKPEEAMKKFQGGQINFKTEAKNPIIHLSVGKTSFDDVKLSDNIKTVITAIKKDRIKKVTLKSTMSPGIKLNV